jgi:hypothetical protein
VIAAKINMVGGHALNTGRVSPVQAYASAIWVVLLRLALKTGKLKLACCRVRCDEDVIVT